MQKDLLISLLRQELVEKEQEAARLKRVAEEAQAEAVRQESLAASIRTTLQGISGQESQEQKLTSDKFRQLPTKANTKGTLLNGRSNGTQVSTEIPLEAGKGANLSEERGTNSNPKSGLKIISRHPRHPKEYQRPEYKSQGGYIQIVKQILEKHPEGLHIGQLVEIIFEYQSSDEFTKAKRCLQAELMRGVKENRLVKEGEYYLSQPRTIVIATASQSQLNAQQNK